MKIGSPWRRELRPSRAGELAVSRQAERLLDLPDGNEQGEARSRAPRLLGGRKRLYTEIARGTWRLCGEPVLDGETARPTKASPVTEYTGLKPLAEATFTVNKEPVQTIALCFKASKQVLADWPELESFLRNEFASRVREEEDAQILLGSGTPPNLNGLVPQAQAWDISLLTASDGYEYPDILAGAMQQIAEDDELDGRQFAVLHPGDAWKIRRLKDSQGRYIFAGPNGTSGPLNLWGAPVAETTIITKGTFLVGSADPAAVEIRDRESLQIELSTEDGSNFLYNLVTVRAELRTALVVKRPNAFVHGNLTQSPA